MCGPWYATSPRAADRQSGLAQAFLSALVVWAPPGVTGAVCADEDKGAVEAPGLLNGIAMRHDGLLVGSGCGHRRRGSTARGIGSSSRTLQCPDAPTAVYTRSRELPAGAS